MINLQTSLLLLGCLFVLQGHSQDEDNPQQIAMKAIAEEIAKSEQFKKCTPPDIASGTLSGSNCGWPFSIKLDDQGNVDYLFVMNECACPLDVIQIN